MKINKQKIYIFILQYLAPRILPGSWKKINQTKSRKNPREIEIDDLLYEQEYPITYSPFLKEISPRQDKIMFTYFLSEILFFRQEETVFYCCFSYSTFFILDRKKTLFLECNGYPCFQWDIHPSTWTSILVSRNFKKI